MNATEHDAREFGLHVKQGAWRLGLLVARNVQPGNGQSERGSRRRNDRSDEKISASKFAELSGTSQPRVMRYLNAWNRAAEAGLVPMSRDLMPGDDPDLDWDSLPDWNEFYDGRKQGGYNGAKDRKPTTATVDAVLELPAKDLAKFALDAIDRPGVADEIAKNPGGRSAAMRMWKSIEDDDKAATKDARRKRKTQGGISEARDIIGFMVEVVGELGRAKRALQASYNAAREYDIGTDDAEEIEEHLGEIVQIVDWYRSYLESGDQTFEEELNKLLGGE